MHSERVFWGPPERKEIELLNASTRNVIIVVSPTITYHESVGRLNFSTKFPPQVEVGGEISKNVTMELFPTATKPQIFKLRARKESVDPKKGQKCPKQICRLSEFTSAGEVRCSVFALDDETIRFGGSQLVPQRHRFAVLPGMFEGFMMYHPHPLSEFKEKDPGDIALRLEREKFGPTQTNSPA